MPNVKPSSATLPEGSVSQECPPIRVLLGFPNGAEAWFTAGELEKYAAVGRILGGVAVEWKRRKNPRRR